MKTFPRPVRAVPSRKYPTPIAIPLVDVLPSQSRGLTPDWLKPAPAPTPPPIASNAVPSTIDPVAAEAAQLDLENARRDAEDAGLKSAQAKIEALAGRYLDAISRLDAAIRAVRPSAVEIVDLALVVAKEILGHEATVNHDVVVRAIDGALAQTRELDDVTVRVGPTDLQYIKQRRPDLADAGIRFVQDASLAVGGCIVETPLEVRDASLEARLEATRSGLVELLREQRGTGVEHDVQSVDSNNSEES